MKALLLFIASFLLIPVNEVDTNVAAPSEEIVYICTGPKAKKYHKTDKCNGIQQCSKSIIKVTVSNAKSQGFSYCLKCYPYGHK